MFGGENARCHRLESTKRTPPVPPPLRIRLAPFLFDSRHPAYLPKYGMSDTLTVASIPICSKNN